MTLQEVKDYMRIDGTEEDAFLNELIDISDIYIESCVGTAYKSNTNLTKLSTIAQRKIIADMYSNRSDYIEGKYKKDIIITTIFDKLSNIT